MVATVKDHGAVWACGMVTLLSLAALCLGSWGLFVCGRSLQPWLFPAAVVAAALCVGMLFPYRKIWYGVAYAVVLMAVAVAFCSLFDDYSRDGNTYHQEIIIYLLDGWNPFRVLEPAPQCSLWSMHYAKAPEIMGACVASTTGLIESGKAVNIFIVAAAFLLTLDFLGSVSPDIARWRCVTVAAIASANVIGMAQVMTFYTDFYSYYFILLTIVLSADYVRNRSRFVLFAAGMVCIMAVITKFTAFFYEGLAVAAILLWLWVTGRRLQAGGLSLMSTYLAAALVGMFVVGWHPYVTNIFSGGNPFYPLIGADDVDIMTGNTPECFSSMGRVSSFLSSLFSVGFPKYDQRSGGFGPLMIPMLVVSFAVVFRGRDRRDPLVYICVITLLSCFCFSQAWWARYISQLWLIVVCGAYAALIEGRDRSLWLGMSVAVMALGSGATAFAAGVAQGARYRMARERIYRLSEGKRPVVDCCWASVKRHFYERNIEVVSLDDVKDRDRVAECERMAFYGSLDYSGSLPVVVGYETEEKR